MPVVRLLNNNHGEVSRRRCATVIDFLPEFHTTVYGDPHRLAEFDTQRIMVVAASVVLNVLESALLDLALLGGR